MLATLWICHAAVITVKAGVWPKALLSYQGSASDALVVFALVFAPIVGTVLGSIVMGTEFSWRSWPILLTQGVGRRRILGGKLLVMIVLVAGSIVLSTATALALAGVTQAIGPTETLVSLPQLLVQAAVALLAAGTWGLIASAVTLLSRSTAIGLIVVGGYAIAENVLELSNAVRPMLVAWNIRSLVSIVGGTVSTLRITKTIWPYPPLWATALLLSVLLAVCIALVLTAFPGDPGFQLRLHIGTDPLPDSGVTAHEEDRRA